MPTEPTTYASGERPMAGDLIGSEGDREWVVTGIANTGRVYLGTGHDSVDPADLTLIAPHIASAYEGQSVPLLPNYARDG